MASEPRDGQKIAGLEVVVVPDWLMRRLSDGTMAILMPQTAADEFRRLLDLALTTSGQPKGASSDAE